MYAFLDKFFFIFHGLIIVFSLCGWMWKKTRRANLIVLSLIAGSWFVLGLWYGIGYCPCTDWHWQVRTNLGHYDMPNSYVKFLIDSITGLDLNANLVDILTLTFYVSALAASLFTNLLAWKQKYASHRFKNLWKSHDGTKVSVTKRLAVFAVSLLLACSQRASEGITNTNQEREYRSEHFKFYLTEFESGWYEFVKAKYL